MALEPKRLATAEFTKDMVETLRRYFDEFETNGIVRVDVTDKGLWLHQDDGQGQKFLGSVKPFRSDGSFH